MKTTAGDRTGSDAADDGYAFARRMQPGSGIDDQSERLVRRRESSMAFDGTCRRRLNHGNSPAFVEYQTGVAGFGGLLRRVMARRRSGGLCARDDAFRAGDHDREDCQDDQECRCPHECLCTMLPRRTPTGGCGRAAPRRSPDPHRRHPWNRRRAWLRDRDGSGRGWCHR